VGSLLAILGQQGLAQETPLTLNVTSIPAEPDVVQVTLTNQSNHPVKIVRPSPTGQLQNLQLVFVAAGTGDTTVTAVHPLTPEQIAASAGQMLTNLAAGAQITFPLAIESLLPSGGHGTLRLIYSSIYQTPVDTLNLPPRAQVWSEDVQSNAITV